MLSWFWRFLPFRGVQIARLWPSRTMRTTETFFLLFAVNSLRHTRAAAIENIEWGSVEKITTPLEKCFLFYRYLQPSLAQSFVFLAQIHQEELAFLQMLGWCSQTTLYGFSNRPLSLMLAEILTSTACCADVFHCITSSIVFLWQVNSVFLSS